MNNRCGCEDGGDCTRTSVCQVQSALEIQFEDIYNEINAMGGSPASAKEMVEMAFLDEVLDVLEKFR